MAIMSNSKFSCLVTCLILIFQVKAFEYSDLVALNVSCAPKDSCLKNTRSRLSSPVNWNERNCFCDNLCGYYGDCCLNAVAYARLEQQHDKLPQECVVLRNYGGVYMKKKCSIEWQGDPDIEVLCKAASPHSGADRPDPFISLPVTSKTTQLTYGNYYCALCNNDTVGLDMWLPRIECPTLHGQEKLRLLNLSLVVDQLDYINGSWQILFDYEGKDEYHLCTVDPYEPDTVVQYTRQCKEMIYKCPDRFADNETKDLCNSYTSVIYSGVTAYRNYHCANCHNVVPQSISCYRTQQLFRFNFKDDFNRGAFSMLFDFTDNNGGNSVGFKCKSTEIWDPFFKKCRLVLCPATSSSYDNGRCYSGLITNNTDSFNISPNGSRNTNNSTDGNGNIDESERLVYYVNGEVYSNGTHKSQNIIFFPDEVITFSPAKVTTERNPTFLNCNRICLPHDEFLHIDDGMIEIPKYKKVLSRNQYEIHDCGVLVCLFESTSEKFSNIMGWVSLAGLGVSFVCLILHLIAFILVPELRNLSGKNLASLSLSLLAAYSCFILGIFGEEGKIECIVLASLMYYFFLASFCWMNVMAFDVWRTLRLATSELRVSAGEQWKKFFIYCAYAWLSPAVALSIMLAIDLLKPQGFSKDYLPDIGQRLCWFGQRKALLVFFAAPLTIIMLLNIIFFIMAAKMIAKTAHSTAKFSAYQPQQSHFKLYMRLALLMGLAWISGIMAGYLQEETLWYVFIILNTFQGAFIFAAFTCKRKVLNRFCCGAINLPRPFGRPVSSARRNLESRDSGNSHASQTSVTSLTPHVNTSFTNTSSTNITL